jgi:uncharacterized protein YbjT (DUF2867 family)
MNVVIFGATGMVGAGALLECLDDPRVTSVLAVVRTPTGRAHPKLREVVHADFFDFSPLADDFAVSHACLYCLGVSSAGMSEAHYASITRNIALAAGRALAAANPSAVLCFVSGAGADSSARGRSMWARVKGQTENDLLALPLRAIYVFRPAFIQPVRGVRSRTDAYRAFYTVMAPVSPVLRFLLPWYWTSTARLGRAMITAAIDGAPRRILRSRDINRLARRAR